MKNVQYNEPKKAFSAIQNLIALAHTNTLLVIQASWEMFADRQVRTQQADANDMTALGQIVKAATSKEELLKSLAHQKHLAQGQM